jgi:hypothetical protein
MGGASSLLLFSAAAGVVAIAVLRFAWSLPRRSVTWNAAGWGLLAVACIGAMSAEGAWGAAVTTLVIMATAAVALTVAAAKSPPGRVAASNRRVGMLPEHGEPRRIGRRFGTFGLVIVAGLVVSVSLAMAVRGLGAMLGWSEANSNALALFTVPVAWAVLSTILLMQERRRDQVLTLVASGLPLIPVLVAGVMS